MTNAEWSKIKRRCLREHGVRPYRAPEGYFYWIGRDDNCVEADSEYVYRASDLTEAEWLSRAADAAAQSGVRAIDVRKI